MTAPSLPVKPWVGARWSARFGWGTFGAALAVFTVAALANMQTGMDGDPRTVNPHPPPAPYPPFLGIGNWPLVTSASAAALTVGLFGVLTWWSVSHRCLHWAVIIAIAAFFAGALDPLANWATFTVFDPRVGHFPTSWPYFNASPLLEPTLSFLGGYASYYVLTGLGLLTLHQRFVAPRLPAGTWLQRHPLACVFLTGFLVGLPLNAVMQFLWLKVGLFVYTQAAGPVIHVAERNLPVLMVIYDSVLFAMVAVLCVKDEQRRPAIITGLAHRLPARQHRPRVTTVRQLIAATALLLSVVVVPIGIFSLLRVTGHTKPAYDTFPYPTVKEYDPYGDLHRAGKPGPFYR